MIGTEAGVGVRNQGGHIQAEKTLTVSSEGKLTWQSGKQEAVTEAAGIFSWRPGTALNITANCTAVARCPSTAAKVM